MEDDVEKPEAIKLPAKKPKNLLWLWILITAIIVGGGVMVFAYRSAIKNYFWPSTIDGSVQDIDNGITHPSTTTSVKIVDSGVTWLNPRVKLADLGLFKTAAGSNSDPSVGFPGYLGTDYYKVATTSDGGDIILAVVKVEELGTFDDFHHFKKLNGVYYWLSQNSDPVGGDGNYYSRINSQVDNSFTIASLQLDKSIAKGSTTLTQKPSDSRNDTFVADTTVGTKVEETKWGDLYLAQTTEITKSVGNAKVSYYYILRNDGIRIIYSPSPSFRNDDGSLVATWTNAVGQSAKFSPVATSGCGAVGGTWPKIIDTTSLQNKVQVGTAGATKIYSFPAASPMMSFGYQVYLMDGMSGKASEADFASNLGIIAIEDGYGNWEAFMNDKYAPGVECGKPVIYLYPKKSTEVSLKVGANVTKSDPAYNSGWRVLASPSGLLSLGGKTYDSLFWEGTGWGSYPAVTNGTVVESSKIAETITSQLLSMGLNSKEIADFKAFWLPKMPQTPFTRLTWLTTDQMNTLAPLAVSPKPDTTIRVFLDFEGLQSKINIAPQILPKYQRVGFTLVEWGGLLKGKK